MNIIRNLIVKFLGEDEYNKFEDCIRMYNNVSPNKLDSSNLVLDNIIQMIICFIQNNLDPNGEYKKVLDWTFIFMFAEQGCYTDSLSQIIDYDNIIPQDLFVVLENNCHGFECAGQVCSNAMDFINKTYAMTGNSTPNMTFKELFKQVTKMWPRQAMKATLEFDSFFSGNSQLEGASDSLRIKSVATQNVKEEEEEFVPIKLESGSFDDYKSKIISLIDNNVKQIIFTGAPGTGKTFLAKEVSKTYGKKEDVKCINGGNYQLVQFHTSFDYTDFVEGLRPMESREKVVEFRKVDGIFKEFCRKVEEENIKDIYGLESRIGNQSSFEDLYLKYIKSIIKTSYDGDYCNLNEPKVNYELRMKLKDIVTDDSLRLIEKTTWGQIADGNIDKFMKEHIDSKIRIYNPEKLIEFLNFTPATQPLVQTLFTKLEDGSYRWNYNTLDKKKYFFIIDEINRADLSKVLGELMYCFEKDKRGPGNPVQTQYRNLKTYACDKKRELAKFEDVFVDGFFIPENVIIVGTMNDIDRSVESMDFALRRRFIFEEFYVDFDNLMVAFTSSSFKFDFDLSLKLAVSTMLLNKYIHIHGEQYGLNSHYDISQGQFSDCNKKMIKEGSSKVKEYVWDYRVKSLIREYLRGENETEVNNFIEDAKDIFYLDVTFNNTSSEDAAKQAAKFFKHLMNDKIKKDDIEAFFKEIFEKKKLDDTKLWTDYMNK